MSRHTAILLGAALLAAASLPAAEARADACIPPAVTEALADCSAAASLPAMPVAELLRAAGQPPHAPTTLGTPGRKGRPPVPPPRELDAAEKAQEGALHRFVCEDKPADARALEQHADLELARARLYFGANHFQEAAAAFRDIALHRAGQPAGIFATQLYLESLNLLATAGATSCFDDMARDVPTFIGLHCRDGREKANADACDVLERIQVDLLRLRAEQRVRAADRGDAASWSAYEAGAGLYLQIWREHGKAACEARLPGCNRMEEILYNAARAYQGARLIDESIATRKLLLDPRYHLERTELARKSVYEIGGNYQAMARYDEAAPWYERYALENPAAEKAPDALQDAIVLRLGVGHVAQAVADADAYSKLYGSKRPAASAQIAFAIAAHALDHADREGARRRFTAAMPAIDKGATIDVQIRAHASLARALAELGKPTEAAEEYGKVRALFRDPAGVVAKLRSMGEDAWERALVRVLTAVGEATLFFAEEKRRAVDAIKLPAAGGSDVAVYTRTTLVKGLAQKRGAIDEAEKAYAEVLALQPAPPPRWVVDAAARVGRMHGKLAAEIRAAPAPKGLKAELRAAWTDALDEASEPQRARARAAYRRCVDLSVKFQYTDELARGCAAWLSRHYPAEYPRLDELADKPTRFGFVLEHRPVPQPAGP